MILGIGADLCSIERIAGSLERFGERFAERVFTPAERTHCDTRQANRAACYAKRWAAKEACAKALGTGFRGELALADIGVESGPLGRPALVLTGAARMRLDALVPPGHAAHVHLTLTDDPPWAQAFVVIEAVKDTQ